MTEQILQAARELGIESKILIVEDQHVNPLVTVIEGTRAIQTRISAHWFMDSSLVHVKTILYDLHRIALNS